MRRRRPGRPAQEVTDEDRKRLGGPVPRQLYRTGGSLVVAVPSHIVEYLDARVGMQLWWSLGAGREAVVRMHPQRVGGRPGGLAAARELAAARVEIDRLKRRLGARPEAVYNEGVNEGRTRHMGELVKLGTQLDELTKTVADLAARMPFGRRRHGRVAQGATSPASAPRAVDAIPLPDLPSSPEVVGRGADTSGPQAPGVPL